MTAHPLYSPYVPVSAPTLCGEIPSSLWRLRWDDLKHWSAIPFVLLFFNNVYDYFTATSIGVQVTHGEFYSSALGVIVFHYGLLLFIYATVMANVQRLDSIHWSYAVLLAGVFAYPLAISFDWRAAVFSLGEFTWPIAALLFGYLLRYDFPRIIRAFLLLVLVNDAFQCLLAVIYYSGLEVPWLWYKPFSALVVRGTGFVGVAAFGYINFSAAIISYYLLKNKRLSFLFLGFCFASISFKILIFAMAFLVLVVMRRTPGVTVLVAVVGLLVGVLASSQLGSPTQAVVDAAQRRVDNYIIRQETMRNMTYVYSYESLLRSRTLGEGLGYFGGQGSLRYNSPAFQDPLFISIPGRRLRISASDTYYPQVFVELGLVGGIIYLAYLALPLLHWRGTPDSRCVYYWIVAALMFDSLASTALASRTCVMACTVFLYGLSHYAEIQALYARTATGSSSGTAGLESQTGRSPVGAAAWTKDHGAPERQIA